jgi:hypothetical protein
MRNPPGHIYDVNSTASNHQHPITYFAGLPNDPLQTYAPDTTPAIDTIPNLQHISNFFLPRSILRTQDPIPKANDIFGDAMTTPITPNRTRLYFINLNGINLTKGAVKFCTFALKSDRPISISWQ